MIYKDQYKKYFDVFEEELKSVLCSFDNDAARVITEAMSYSVLNGGKRVRPVLCFATADALGIPLNDVKELAVAIEMIHSYSLVHDDLPAMDNDDYRRGKLSTHKKYGEAIGILAGDALLNFAFEVLLSKENVNDKYVKACRIIANYAGYSGMINGQVLDLTNEKNPNLDEKVLYDIINNKTAKLITAPIIVVSEMAGGKYRDELLEFGFNLGALFQITDDIMDETGTLDEIGKTPHKDKEVDKLTSIKIFGLDGAKKLAEEHYIKCKNIITKLDNCEFLSQLTDAMYQRKK